MRLTKVLFVTYLSMIGFVLFAAFCIGATAR